MSQEAMPADSWVLPSTDTDEEAHEEPDWQVVWEPDWEADWKAYWQAVREVGGEPGGEPDGAPGNNNIFDPLNLNSLLDEEVNRAANAETPKSSPLPEKNGPIEILIPKDITDPLNLNCPEDEGLLVSPLKSGGRRRHRNKHRRAGGRSLGESVVHLQTPPTVHQTDSPNAKRKRAGSRMDTDCSYEARGSGRYSQPPYATGTGQASGGADRPNPNHCRSQYNNNNQQH